jgi:ankyrin repeat protein
VNKLLHDFHVPADALPRGRTAPALLMALGGKHFRCAAALLAAGADINRYIEGGGNNALTLHVARGDVPQVKWLLDQGADPAARVRATGYAYYNQPLEDVAGADRYAVVGSRAAILALLRAARPWHRRRVAVIAAALDDSA